MNVQRLTVRNGVFTTIDPLGETLHVATVSKRISWVDLYAFDAYQRRDVQVGMNNHVCIVREAWFDTEIDDALVGLGQVLDDFFGGRALCDAICLNTLLCFGKI